MQNTHIKEPASRKVFLVCNNVFFAFIFFVTFYPLWYIFIQSLSDSQRAIDAMIVPLGFTLENYRELLGMTEIFRAFGISVLRTVIGTVSAVMCSMLLGYLFSKEDMPFRKFLYRFLVITMYVSGGLIPTFLVYKSYGLLNNFWVYILPSLVSAYHVILIKTYIEQMPIAVEESAMIDGAGTMTIFFKIILPLAMPIMATIAIFVSVSQWNSWFDNNIYTVTNKSLTTLQYLLHTYLQQAEQVMEAMKENDADLEHMLTPRGLKMTVTMITVVPILCVYPFMQRYLIKGIMVGAVKG